MSDLSGTEAFDRVLELLTEANLNERRAREERDLAREQLAAARQESVRLNARLIEVDDARKRAEPLLSELWNAAQASATGPTSEPIIRERLQKALHRAAGDCGEIPF